MADSHTEGAECGKFCALRMEECPCGNKYKDVMNGEPESWGKYPQAHRVLGMVERAPEAHHVLPVASVAGKIVANKKIKKEVRENTEWCVNAVENMIALPLFEMTFLHYLLQGDDDHPPFENLPMHNYDHGAFQTEVATKLEKVGQDAAQNKKKHEKVTEQLLADLNALRKHYKPELAKRGTRGKKTHGEFTYAMNAKDGDPKAEKWYIPFSMALKPAPKPFPYGVRKNGLDKKLNDLRAVWEKFLVLG